MAVAFDSSGGGTSGLTSVSYTHTVNTAGADVFIGISPDRQTSISSITWGGANATFLGSMASNNSTTNGTTYVYHVANVSSGSTTVSVTAAVASWVVINSVAYTGVVSIGSAQTTFGSGTALSQTPAAPGVGEMVVQFFGTADNGGTGLTIGSLSGGTNRYNNGNNSANLVINDSTGSATYSGTATSSTAWCGIAFDLSPNAAGGADPGLGARITPQIPNPYVGPQALRNQKRMPYVSSQKQGYTDAANQTITIGNGFPYGFPFGLGNLDGFVQSGGAMPPLQIPNPFVGPQALRQQKRMAAQVQQVLAFPPASSLTDIFSSTNSNWTYSGATVGGNQVILTGSLRSTGTYDLTGSQVTLEVMQVPTGGGFVALQAGHGIAATASIYQMFVQSGSLTIYLYDPYGNPTQVFQGSFNSQTMQFWRIREAGGSIFFDTAPDGVSWTNQYHEHAGIRLSDVQFGIQAVSGTAIVGYFNLLPSPYSYAPTQIANPFVGPMALRQQKRVPYVSSRAAAGSQSLSDGANSTWTFTTSDDGFVQPGGLMPPLQIPNPFVGPQALRNQKRMPYVAAQRQGFTDAANQSIVFSTSTDGFIQPGGLMPPLVIPNPFVGPQALRNQKRMPYISAQRQGFTDGANQTITFSTSDDGFVQPGGLMPPLQIPNPFVGPQALRNTKRMPYVSWQQQGFTDGASLTITFSTSDDGYLDHPGAKTAVIIPNPAVGPQALRNTKRWPYVASQRQGFTDGANQTIVFATSDDGFVDRPYYVPIQIPNPFVGPMAMRNRKRMPSVRTVTLTQQSLSDGANSTWTFTTSTDGRRGIKDGANSTWTFTATTNGFRGIKDGANITVTFVTSDDGFLQSPYAYRPTIIPNPFVGPMAQRVNKRMPVPAYRRASFSDGANLTLVLSVSTDGNVTPFLIDVHGTVVVGPNEIRSITLPAELRSLIIGPANPPDVVFDADS